MAISETIHWEKMVASAEAAVGDEDGDSLDDTTILWVASQLAAANEAREKAQGALCRAREVLQDADKSLSFAAGPVLAYGWSMGAIRDKIHTFLAKTAPCPHAEREKALEESEAHRPTDLRAQGWMIAVHNDYRQDGIRHTFWLLTKGNECVKGEGRSDADALDSIRAELRRRSSGGTP